MIGYGIGAFLPFAVVLWLGRALPFWAARRGRLGEPDARGMAFVLGTLLGLLAGVGIASYSEVAFSRLPLMTAAVALLLVLVIGLVGKYYLSLGTKAVAGLILLAGLVPAVAEIAERGSAPAAVLAGIMVLVPIGISLAAYLVNQFESDGDIWMAALAMAALAGVAFLKGESTALFTLLAGFGAMVALLAYAKRQRAKSLIGDVGMFALGALVAVVAISGGFVIPAVIILFPYFLNLALKAGGRSLEQLVMRASGGSRHRMALILIGSEVVFGLIAVLVCVQG